MGYKRKLINKEDEEELYNRPKNKSPLDFCVDKYNYPDNLKYAGSDWGLCTRLTNSLRKAGYRTIEEVEKDFRRDEEFFIRHISMIGKKSMEELRELFKQEQNE